MSRTGSPAPQTWNSSSTPLTCARSVLVMLVLAMGAAPSLQVSRVGRPRLEQHGPRCKGRHGAITPSLPGCMLEQVVLHGEERCRRTAGDAELVVDILDVPAGRLRRDGQFLGDHPV